eukprot:1161967-Pelagomonas_calceolata.AAC.6
MRDNSFGYFEGYLDMIEYKGPELSEGVRQLGMGSSLRPIPNKEERQQQQQQQRGSLKHLS